MNDPMRILENAHMMEIILFIKDNEGCMKKSIYTSISHNHSTPSKLSKLEEAGIISSSCRGRATFLTLTDKGRRVADLLDEIRAVLREDEASSRPRRSC